MSQFSTYRESERVVPRSGRGWTWPAVVVGLLLLNVSVCAVTVVSAIRSPAHVEDEYYTKAVEWDARRRDWPSPATHGWSIDASVSRAGNGQSLVGVRLRDAGGAPVRDARVECVWFPVLEPDRRERLVFEPASPAAATGLGLDLDASQADPHEAWHLGVPPDGIGGRWKLTVDVVAPAAGSAPERRARTQLDVLLD